MRSRLRRSILALLIALAGAGCAKKSDPVEPARQFFQQIAAGQIAEAYASAAFGFRAQQTEKAFAQTVKEIGLADHAAVQWEPPEIKDREAKIRVEVSTRTGERIPFTVTLLNESGAWRIYSMRLRGDAGGRSQNRFSLVGKGSAFSDSLSRPVPEERDLRRLVTDTLLTFDAAIQQRSFTDFYETVSEAWQKQLTLGQLERAFQPFIENNVRLGGVRDAEMALDGPPSINTDGVLVVNGHFPTAPYKTFFSLKYVYELPRWKLFGIDVNLQR
ncbi:MAG: hypothetical protein QOE70_2081 [Chthoniobacter sp.]|jgi:hypothetical protein|nr:hypothetical protein [Chthoniobacter sp.]